MIYLIVIILLLLLSFRYDINGKTRGRELSYVFVLIIFVMLAGLRWRIGVDTPNYLNRFYYVYPTLDKFSLADYPIGKDPFYVLMNSFVKTLGFRFYVVQIIHAAFVNILIFKYFKKHTKYVFTCAFFYFITAYSSYCTEIMRGSMSIVICLYAYDYFLEKKWFKGYLLLLLALMFHVQTIIIFVTPFLLFLRFNKFGVFALLVALFAGYFIQITLGDYIELFEMAEDVGAKAEKYATSDKYGGQEHNWKFFMVRQVSLYAYAFLSLIIVKTNINGAKQHLCRFEPFLMLGAVFLMMRFSIEIFYRFVEYYNIYFVLFWSELFVSQASRMDFRKPLSYVRTFVLFFPFFLGVIYRNSDARVIPYSSVIERSISKERETIMMVKKRPVANRNLY